MKENQSHWDALVLLQTACGKGLAARDPLAKSDAGPSLLLPAPAPSGARACAKWLCCPAGEARGEASGGQGGRGARILQAQQDPILRANRVDQGGQHAGSTMRVFELCLCLELSSRGWEV